MSIAGGAHTPFLSGQFIISLFQHATITFSFFSESVFLCNFMLNFVSSTRKHMITRVGCNTFSLLNVVAYSLQEPLKIIIGYKKIIFWVGLVFLLLGWGRVF